MKVKNPHVKNMANLGTNKTQSAPTKNIQKNKMAKAYAANTKESGSSQVNLSTRAQQMQKAKSIASEPSFNEAKVARLQKMIDNGNYKVDSASVADRLVDNHLIFGD